MRELSPLLTARSPMSRPGKTTGASDSAHQIARGTAAPCAYRGAPHARRGWAADHVVRRAYRARGGAAHGAEVRVVEDRAAMRAASLLAQEATSSSTITWVWSCSKMRLALS